MDLMYILKLLMQKQPLTKDILIIYHKKLSINQMILKLPKPHSMNLKLWMQTIICKSILKLDHQLKTQMSVDQEVISKTLHSQQDTLSMD